MKKKLILVLGIALLLFTACSSAPTQAQVVRTVDLTGVTSYYVRANGNDSNMGTSEDTPFQTLERAVSAASTTTVKKITIIGQINNVAIEITNSGETEILITGKQNPSEQEKAVIRAATNRNCLTIQGKSNIRFEYITFTGANWPKFVCSNGATITLANGAVITENIGTSNGGTGLGMFIYDNSTVLLTGNTQIINNRNISSGGGIFIQDSVLVVEGDVLIASNTTTQRNGGAINAQSSKVTITGNAQIINNTAGGTGGGITLAGTNGSSLTIGGNAVISGNRATEGGGVIVWGDSTVTILDNARITSNTATSYGGGVQLNGGRIIQGQAAISGNTAPTGPDIFYYDW